MDKLQSALKYAEQGYSVLPLDGKKPRIKFADTPPLTAAEIKHYWTIWPNANIALRTIDFFVVDIDTKNEQHKKSGIENAKRLIKAGILIPTLEQRTASGGWQLFYKQVKPETDRQAVGFKPGIDIKGKTNNYVVVPPSTTSKGQYKWIDETATMQAPTDGLVEMIKDFQPPTRFKLPHFKHTTGKMWTGMVLDNIISGAPQGQRNSYLTSLCGQMIHAGAENETVWTLLNYANEFNSPPLPEKEVGKIVQSVLKRELKK